MGYTSHAISTLERSRAFLLPNLGPKVIGGEGKVTPAIRRECLDTVKPFVRLVGETLLAEFPSFEVLSAFHVLGLDHKTLEDFEDNDIQSSRSVALQQLAKVAHVNSEELTWQFEDATWPNVCVCVCLCVCVCHVYVVS